MMDRLESMIQQRICVARLSQIIDIKMCLQNMSEENNLFNEDSIEELLSPYVDEIKKEFKEAGKYDK